MNTTTTSQHSGVTVTRVAKGHYTITSTVSRKEYSFNLLRDAQNFIFANWYSLLTN